MDNHHEFRFADSMSTSSEPLTPGLSEEPDTVADLLDQFYSNAWDDEEKNEEEDAGLYGLYDRYSPLSGAISPPPILKRELSLKQPLDEEILAEKLWNYLESAARSRTPDFQHDPQNVIDTQNATPEESRESSSPTTRLSAEANHNLHQKLPQILPLLHQTIGLESPPTERPTVPSYRSLDSLSPAATSTGIVPISSENSTAFQLKPHKYSKPRISQV